MLQIVRRPVPLPVAVAAPRAVSRPDPVAVAREMGVANMRAQVARQTGKPVEPFVANDVGRASMLAVMRRQGIKPAA